LTTLVILIGLSGAFHNKSISLAVRSTYELAAFLIFTVQQSNTNEECEATWQTWYQFFLLYTLLFRM